MAFAKQKIPKFSKNSCARACGMVVLDIDLNFMGESGATAIAKSIRAMSRGLEGGILT